MSVRWETLFSLAEKTACEGGVVLKRTPDLSDASYDAASLREARLRCAISRAYYAAFNEARAWWDMEFPDDKVPDYNAHENLIHKLTLRQEWRPVSKNLGELLRYRKAADYKASVDNLDDTTVTAVALCNSLLNDIGGLVA